MGKVVLSREEKLKKLQAMDGLVSPEDGVDMAIETFSSGCISVDLALGGGWAKGRVAEIYGPESSGKTTLALMAIAEVQRQGGVAVFIDAEHALSWHWAETLGVDKRAFQFFQPESGEEALNKVDEVLKQRLADIIVIDSVSALTPQEEIDKGFDQNSIGLQARLMSKAMRKIVSSAQETNCVVLFINQIRMKIGVMYGNPETTSGGNALKFAASQRVEIRKKEFLKKGTDEPWGLKSKVKVVKNKIAPPYREAELNISFEKGVLKAAALLDAAEKLGVVTRGGAYYKYNGENLGMGAEKSQERLSSDPALWAQVDAQVRSIASKASKDRPKALKEDNDDEAPQDAEEDEEADMADGGLQDEIEGTGVARVIKEVEAATAEAEAAAKPGKGKQKKDKELVVAGGKGKPSKR